MNLNQDNLLNRYLQAVGFWLPRRQKDDILAELAEDLRQQMEDREEELGRGLEDADIKAILKQRGQPMRVAASFLPQQSLIGPVLYPIYLMVLKIVVLVTLLINVIATILSTVFNHAAAPHPIAAVLRSVGAAWSIFFIQFGIVTLIFAAIDRYAAASIGSEDWDPGKLARVRVSKPAKRLNLATELVFGVIGLVWLLAVPSYPFLLVGPASLIVKPAPIWSEVYIPLLVLAMAGITENVITLLRPDLRWFRPVFRILSSAFCIWIGYRLLQAHEYAIGLTAGGAQYTTIINQILHWGILGTMAGFGIAICVHVWELVKDLMESVQSTNVRLA
ncbi:putative membrane protein [Silvibacterium bohemicum]|uniref:Putative membrane protein n=1 Tax=Silvibacterium bohemicum TaxID=1577686 RepID=A0A841K5M5_9BACT|nr:hypothetical protein [Silvibacterium bohemicum]MBB6146441.1 putative membrane protein [Silvibacterium bohemicum]